MDWQTVLFDVVVMPLVAFIVGLLLVLMMRRTRARLERRVGPPFFQPLYDILKLYSKDIQISHGFIHDLGIIMVVGGYITVEMFLPVPGMVGLAEKGDLIALVYLMMVPSLGMALGVGQCANPNGSIGISRALISMLGYDIPFVLVVVAAAAMYGTTSLPEIIAIQQQGGISTWGIASMPVMALAGIITTHVMLAKEPFETYIAPAEIATGPMVEMGGKFMGGLFVVQTFQVYTAGVLYTTLFLGGGLTWFDFLPKVFAVLFLPFAITILYPRYKAGEGLLWVWKWPTGIALLGLALIFMQR
ncbi:MAG: NADH-quinone oxidoreductase subunit H [Gammaproteobacteria bacterium]